MTFFMNSWSETLKWAPFRESVFERRTVGRYTS